MSSDQPRTPPLRKFLPASASGLALYLGTFLCLAALVLPGIFGVTRSIVLGQGAEISQFTPAGTAGPGQTETAPPPTFQSESESFPIPEPWNGADRVTVLIVGLDYRDWEAGLGPSRTDTMMLLTIDPVTKTAGMLSIPRDLWANIPGFLPAKINTAYYYGELYKVPGGGPALAMETVEQTIGVPIDYFAQIDFGAFIEFIDLLGGVKIDIPYAISVDPLGDGPIKNLKPGVQTLPGDLALAYARARHTQGGDFDRAQRQQQVVLGIRDRILDFNLLPTLIENADELFAQLSSGIHTNLPLEDVIRLAVLAAQIQDQDINQGVINEQYVTFGRSPDDLSILIPIPDKIRTLRDEIFASTGPLTPFTPGTPQERMQLEAASISILNGSSNEDLGNRTADYLRGLGANVTNVSAAGQIYNQSTITDHKGRPYALAFLIGLLHIASTNIYQEFNLLQAFDVILILGEDWLTNNPMP